MLDELPDYVTLTLQGVSWDEYEDWLRALPEVKRVRLSYDAGRLQIMPVSASHESYAMFFNRLMNIISLRLRLNIRFFGSTTLKSDRQRKGNEPDACFYVQRVTLIGNKITLDFAQDPFPDVAVEVDVFHESLSKFPIYAALDVPEIWHYDTQRVVIYQLQDGAYQPVERSLAVPLLTSESLTEYLNRYRDEGELETLLAFEEWVTQQAATA
ncbi:MAG: Uma2 family endonuclease [Acidobacteria bacterium]|nr:Uma2 family endonuclease [Acidobacteriota bacterium]